MSEKTGGPGPPYKNPNEVEMVSELKFDLNNKYNSWDKGPFFVYIEHLDKHIGRLFPIKIGYYLMNINSIKNDIIDIVSVGVNRVKVIFGKSCSANELVGNEILKKNNLVAYIPSFFNHRKGVIRMIDTFFTEDYLLNAIECDSGNVASVKRMKRKITEDGIQKLVDRQIVVVTFKGNILPEKVRINLTYFTVEPYIFPVVQCFKCLKYGHTAKLCKATNERCKKCTEIHEKDTVCTEQIYCFYCQNSEHISTSKLCPVYIKQRKIKQVMATRNISFKEAEKIVNNPSYSKITSNNRFSILNNEQNFPPLPQTQSTSSSQPTYFAPIHKPKNSSPHSKKRKAKSPPQSPLTAKKPPIYKNNKNSTVTNPYKEEFLEYKEKIIEKITEFVNNYLKSNEEIDSEINYNLKKHISSIFNIENDTEVINISDHESVD